MLCFVTICGTSEGEQTKYCNKRQNQEITLILCIQSNHSIHEYNIFKQHKGYQMFLFCKHCQITEGSYVIYICSFFLVFSSKSCFGSSLWITRGKKLFINKVSVQLGKNIHKCCLPFLERDVICIFLWKSFSRAH